MIIVQRGVVLLGIWLFSISGNSIYLDYKRSTFKDFLVTHRFDLLNNDVYM